MNGTYVGYVPGHDWLHGYLKRIVHDRMGVREDNPAFRVFRLKGSNEVYAYEEKNSGAKVICKFYGPSSAGTGTRPKGARSRSTRRCARCVGTA